MRIIYTPSMGIDFIAFIAIAASFVLKQWWAGIVIIFMYCGGRILERFALHRARRELSSLVKSVPIIAHIKNGNTLQDVHPADIKPGDTLIIKPGETIPVDGIVISGISSVDVSRITGEALPIAVTPHTRLMAGSVNQNGLLELHALADAGHSQQARMIALVREAEESKAPIVRLANSYSTVFTIITFSLAGIAWYISGDPIRAFAVLVVATPCPLILATPIAILSGLSRSAGRGIIVKQGGALETLARVRAIIFDKTGTLTFGIPKIHDAFGFEQETEAEIIRIATSLDQVSTHVLADALVQYAMQQKIDIAIPADMKEIVGEGVSGFLDGKQFLFGRLSWLKSMGVHIPIEIVDVQKKDRATGIRTVFLACEKKLVGGVRFEDMLRTHVSHFISSLSDMGIEHIAMVTGDQRGTAEKVAQTIGIQHIVAECLPEDKVNEIKSLQKKYGVVAMVGDGLNDAPALATADVGIALAFHGMGVTVDAADIVVTDDDIVKVKEVLGIARDTIKLAKNGIYMGIGMSFVLMICATFGYIPPLYGAILQEVVDVVVIVNALRFSMIRKK